MRIAQVAPLAESVPPYSRGGTERVVSFLTEELVRLGHDVTLFASGDSHTSAKLVSTTARAIRLDTHIRDSFAPQILMLERVIQSADEFDVIHFHISQFHFPSSRRLPVAHVTTLHGRLDIPDARAALCRVRRHPGRVNF
jgi:glycosyltransferase involved in cell wall biosynthesis